MIDLHGHYLPGIDDGAPDLDTAVKMCRMAQRDGCRAVIATPHLRHNRYWNDDLRHLHELWNQVRQEVVPEGENPPPLQVFLGGEIAVHTDSFNEILDEMPGGRLLSLAGSKYLLLELDWHGFGPDPREVIYELRISGWYPIIAHPERVSWLANDPERLESLVAEGALTQITAMSLTGDMGNAAERAARQMLDSDLVHFVASDAHDLENRPPGLSRARRRVQELRGTEVCRKLFWEHPVAVVNNQPIGARDVARGPRPNRWPLSPSLG